MALSTNRSVFVEVPSGVLSKNLNWNVSVLSGVNTKLTSDQMPFSALSKADVEAIQLVSTTIPEASLTSSVTATGSVAPNFFAEIDAK